MSATLSTAVFRMCRQQQSRSLQHGHAQRRRGAPGSRHPAADARPGPPPAASAAVPVLGRVRVRAALAGLGHFYTGVPSDAA